MQFQQQGPRRHVLPQPSPIAPIPLLTQRLGQSPPAPVRMNRQQRADLLQVALRYLSALHQQSVAHKRSMTEEKTGSAREFVGTRILGGFLKNDEFSLGDRHALSLE